MEVPARLLKWQPLVHAAIAEHADCITRFTQELVRIPSVTGEEEMCARVVAHRLKRCGLDVGVFEASAGRPNVVSVLESGIPGPRLLLIAYTDVAPPGPGSEWDSAPFSGDIRDGRLHGRGSVENKSALSAAVYAVNALSNLGIAWRGSVMLAAVCDEEAGAAKGIQYLLDSGVLDADMGINCVSTRLTTIDVARKGVLQANLYVYGRSSHGSRPWQGLNAIDKTVDALHALRPLEQDLRCRTHPLCGHATLNTGTIAGGTVINMVPARCCVGLDRRLVPGETHAGALDEIRAVLEEYSRKDPDFSFSLEQTVSTPALEVAVDSPPVKALLAACTAVNGARPVTGGQDAGTAVGFIAERLGIPVPAFGPGDYLDSSLCPNESINLSEVHKAAEIYTLAMLFLLGI